MVNIVLAIFYQDKKTTYISTISHLLPSPSHLCRLLSLINAFLIIARCEEGSRGPDCNQFAEDEGSRWPRFVSYQLVEAERSRLSGVSYWSWRVEMSRFLLPVYWSWRIEITRVCCQLNKAKRTRWPSFCYGQVFVTSLLKLKDQDDQNSWRE